MGRKCRKSPEKGGGTLSCSFKGKRRKAVFFNFLTHITHHCDCMDKPFEPDIADIGIIASWDPVAIEKATTDLIREHIGKDFFKESWPKIDYTVHELRPGNRFGEYGV